MQQNEHCDWLILCHVTLIKFKCIPTGIQLRSCCPHAVFVCLFLLYDCLRKVLIYNKTLNVCSLGVLGKLVSCVFHRAWCFPRLRLGKHQDSRENKTNCFPRDHTLNVYWVRPKNDRKKVAQERMAWKLLVILVINRGHGICSLALTWVYFL